jgi:diguanylate cyclase (GGDEF)-like protein
MTLKHKILIAVGSTFLVMILILYAVSSTLLLNAFDQLERESVTTDVKRALDGLKNETISLNAVGGDWGAWNETRDFIQGTNPSYVKDNLADSALKTLNLDFMVFLDTSNTLIYAKGEDDAGKATSVSATLLNYVQSHPDLLNFANQKDGKAGLVLLPEGPAFLASWPVSANAFDGPIAGKFMMGRYFDAERQAAFSKQIHLDLAFFRSDEKSNLPDDVQKARFRIIPSQPILVQPNEHNDTINAFARVADLDGNPALELRVERSREILVQGKTTTRYFGLFLLLTGVVILFVLLATIQKTVLNPVTNLIQSVAQVASTQDLSTRLPLKGSDELTTLTQSVNQMLRTLEKAHDELWMTARIDYLTGVSNRRHFMDRFAKELSLAQRHQREFSVLHLDIDHFKQINDTYGHNLGDEVLKAMAAACVRALRNSDIFGRLGGEEFGVILPETPLESAAMAAERLRQAVANLEIPTEKGAVRLTISIGVTQFRPEDDTTPETILQRADQALYEAKNTGRNRVIKVA